MRALIVGAGIAGLTAALSLHEVGVTAVVVDSVAELRPLGVGINLLPHAVAELSHLGLGDALADTAIPIAETLHLDRFGNQIWREPRGLIAGQPWPQYAIHRGELQAILLTAVRERLGPDAVRTGFRFESLSQSSTAVHGLLRDRATGRIVPLSADMLLGADGLYSAVRAHLHPAEGPPRWSGVQLWRGVTEAPPFRSGRSMILAGSNRTVKFVAYPISRAAERRGRALVNWIAEVRVHDEPRDVADWNRVGKLADVLPHIAGWRFDKLDVSALIARSATILEYPMVDRDPLPRWGAHRVTLLGDAAHPMYPIGSNGGSQAVIDAKALANALTENIDPATALAAYEAARRDSVNAIATANRKMPMDHILHAVAERAPRGFTHIDNVLTARELDVIRKAYRATSSRG